MNTPLVFVVVVLVAPVVVVALMLLVVSRAQRARAELAARQIAVTDAIHRELGAVAAPVARRRSRGTWELSIAVPFDAPEVTASVAGVAQRAVAELDGGAARGARIVLVPSSFRPTRRPVPCRTEAS